MSARLAQWGVTYTPGSWIALSGPTSLVVLLPSANGWTPLLDRLWREVLDSTSIVEIASRLAEHGLDDMPSFAAFFWTPTGMRSLVRGDLVVRDAGSDAVVADGQGIQTWSEIGLSGIDRIRVETPGSPSPDGPQLPLVVGTALVSSLVLDAREDAAVESPQGEDLDTEPLSPEERAAIESDDTGQLAAVAQVEQPAQTFDLPEVERFPAQLVISDGTVVDLTQPVRIGRAPSPDGADADVLLVTVRSPQQDISRTHLEVSEQEGQVVVTDLRSTNGTTVTVPGDGELPQRLPSGAPVAIPLGSVLDIGDNVYVRIDPGWSE